jgi:flagellar hook-associated protein 1 FlgK
MSDLFQISTSALQAFQTAISVTSNNIANANTPGYAEETVNLTNDVPSGANQTQIGNGVAVASITRAFSQLAENQLNASQSGLSSLTAQQTFTNQIDNIVGTTAGGVSTALTNYYNAWSTVADDPTSTAARQALLGSAQSLAQAFQTTSGQLQNLNTQLNAGITADVSQINSDAQSIASLNAQIAIGSANGGGQAPNDLQDQRDAVVANLSTLVGISTTTDTNGSVNVFVGTGQPLVLQNNVTQLTTVPNPFDATQLEISTTSSAGNIISNSITSGDLGGLLAARTQVVNPTLNAIGKIAVGLTASANTQQNSGVDLTGALGANLFTPLTVATTASGNNTDHTSATAAITNVGALTGDSYVLAYKAGAYSLTDQTTGAAVTLSGNGTTATPFTAAGLSITLSSLTGVPSAAPAAGDEFLIQPTANAAGNVAVALTDPSQLAAAGVVLETAAGAGNAGNATIGSASVQPPANPNSPTNPNLLTPATITFSSPTQFSVSPPTTGGTYNYVSGSSFAFNGWQVAISGTPAAGDTFTVLPQIASGNNTNALALANQATFGVLASGTISINGATSDLVTSVGSQAQQINTAKTAQTAVNTQAQQTVQSTSGVNLDDEAASLLQWQQAYQASAQAFTIGNSVFTTLLTALSAGA